MNGNIEEIFEEFFKAKAECDKIDKIDKELDEQEYTLVMKYKDRTDIVVGDPSFRRKLEEIHDAMASNYELYVMACKKLEDARKALHAAVIIDN